MIEAHEIYRVNADKPGRKFIASLRRRVADSPLLALTVAAGAGALAYGLLRPRPDNYRGVAGTFARTLGREIRPRHTFKAAIGSLALAYVRRRLMRKMRFR